jgi:ACS family sodium-dependent inorganic phosphate cotransporter
MEQRASRAGGGARSGGGARHASWPEEADDGAEAGEGLAPRSAAAQAAAAAELQQLRVEDLARKHDSRRGLLVVLCALCTALSYCDRVNLSVAVVQMSRELGWGLQDKSDVLSAFFKGYIWTQIPGAYLAQRYGGHVVLGVAALLWSIATLAVPWLALQSSAHVAFGRFMLGAFEGVVFPTIYTLLGARIPADERSRSLAGISIGIFAGAVFSFVASPLLVEGFGWPAVFYFFGWIGVLWVASWFAFCFVYEARGGNRVPLPCFDSAAAPAEGYEAGALTGAGAPLLSGGGASSPGPAAGLGAAGATLETGKRGGTPTASAATWVKLPGLLVREAKHIVMHKVVVAIMYAHFCHNFGSFLLISWMPSYFNEALEMDGSTLALSCLPYVSMALAVALASTRADRVIAEGRRSLEQVRRLSSIIGFLGGGTFMLMLSAVTYTRLGTPWLPVLLLSLALAFHGAGPVSGYEAAKMDVCSPEYVGRMQSISNTLAAFAGVIGVPLCATVKQHVGWAGVFLMLAMVLFSAALVFHRWGRFTGRVVF